MTSEHHTILGSYFSLHQSACVIGDKGSSRRDLLRKTRCKDVFYIGKDEENCFVIRVEGQSDGNVKSAVREIYKKLLEFPESAEKNMIRHCFVQYGEAVNESSMHKRGKYPQRDSYKGNKSSSEVKLVSKGKRSSKRR